MHTRPNLESLPFGPPGQAGEDREGVPSTEEKVEEWRSQREERKLNLIEDKKDKGGWWWWWRLF